MTLTLTWQVVSFSGHAICSSTRWLLRIPALLSIKAVIRVNDDREKGNEMSANSEMPDVSELEGSWPRKVSGECIDRYPSEKEADLLH